MYSCIVKMAPYLYIYIYDLNAWFPLRWLTAVDLLPSWQSLWQNTTGELVDSSSDLCTNTHKQ